MGSQASKPTSDPVQDEKNVEQRASAAPKLADRLCSLSLNPASSYNDGTVKVSSIDSWEAGITPTKALARTVLSKANIFETLVSRSATIHDNQVYNVKLSHPREKVCNQMSSGRCWLFATCNVARMAVIERYKLPNDFEISQSYLFFYDHLEKSNFFLEQMIELAEEPVDARVLQYLCQAPENDGGQWDMVVNLLDKYGCIPKKLYPESYNSSNSGKVGSILTSKMREYALELRAVHARTLASLADAAADKSSAERKQIAIQMARQRKESMMTEVYQILSICCGKPPQPDEDLTWEYEDVNGKAHSVKTSPKKFYAESCAPFNASNCISLINDPRNPYDKLYTVDRLGNVFGARPCLYVNTSSQIMKDVVVSLLKADRPVWFGCDVGKFENTALGIMDTNLMDFKAAFGTDLNMNKAERIVSSESSMTHAMVICAAHVVDGKPVRFLVQNSWSDNCGDKGYFVMTADWFDEYVFQIVAPREMVPKTLRKVFEEGQKDPVVLPAWDPFGSLA